MEEWMADREVIGLGITESQCLFSRCCCCVGCVSGGVVAAWLPGPDRWAKTSVSGHWQQRIRARRDRTADERMDFNLPPIRLIPPPRDPFLTRCTKTTQSDWWFTGGVSPECFTWRIQWPDGRSSCGLCPSENRHVDKAAHAGKQMERPSGSIMDISEMCLKEVQCI